MLNFLTRKRDQQQAEVQEWFACEVHDGACQYAIAAQMAFDAFRNSQKQNLSGDWSNFDRGMELLLRANEELRRLIYGLRPIQLAAGDLEKAVACLAEEIRAAGGPDIEIYCDIQPDLISEHVEAAAFRIIQEALTNACRHSKSEGILIGLAQDEDSLCIQVQDWGVGFDPDAAPQGRYGLEGIRRRVHLLHGIATIHSSPSDGTLVTVELPLKG
jgi:NarL family two-component system sensor histidine kinase LiaS